MTLRLVALALLGASACASPAVLRRASPLEKGAAEFAAEGLYLDKARHDFKGNFGMSARFGISESLDLGVRLTGHDIAATAHYAGPTPIERLPWALSPRAGAYLHGRGVYVQAPFLVGFTFGRWELVAGGQLYVELSPRTDPPGPWFVNVGGGGSLGLSIPLGPIRLMPEFAILQSLVGGLMHEATPGFVAAEPATLYHFGVSLSGTTAER